MVMNRIQFQQGLSLPQFIELYEFAEKPPQEARFPQAKADFLLISALSAAHTAG